MTSDRGVEQGHRGVVGVVEACRLGACGTPIDKKLSMPRRLRW
jgi:hypothetical protein